MKEKKPFADSASIKTVPKSRGTGGGGEERVSVSFFFSSFSFPGRDTRFFQTVRRGFFFFLRKCTCVESARQFGNSNSMGQLRAWIREK